MLFRSPRRLSLFGPPVAAVEAFAKEMALINQAPLLAIRAVMELGLELEEPLATQPATTAITPPTAPAVDPPPERPTPAIGTGLDWQTARDRLIALRRAGESSGRSELDPLRAPADLGADDPADLLRAVGQVDLESGSLGRHEWPRVAMTIASAS